MKVRVLTDFASSDRTFKTGEIVEINPRTDSRFLSTGLVTDKLEAEIKPKKVRKRYAPKRTKR